MERKNVINPKNLPSRLPLSLFLLVYIILEETGAQQWLYGAFGALAVLIVIAYVVDKFRERHTNIL